jgi:hypothetical protein
VFATYGYDADSRVTSITYGYSTSGSCSNPPTNLGNLTYTYDADSRIIGVGGSLAALNLPPPTTSNATYTNRNQVNTWNGVSAASGYRDDLTTDPTNGASYDYDERNQLNTINSTAYSFFYDAFGRRESFDDLGVVESYLYDAMQAVQTTNPSQNFFTTPDGEVLAYSSSSGTFVPLTDVLGSTIALTDSGKLYTQYKYEPFGVPTTSGQSSNYPYRRRRRQLVPLCWR